jgi:hypothetical protein
MGTIDLKFLVKTATYVSMAAAVCLVAQYVGFYIFGTHLQMVPTGLLDPSAKQWILLAQTGQANIHGVMTESYRPSAFFLEPSHLYLYTFPHLCLTLFSGDFSKKNITAVLLISLALLLSTSGMGIAALGGLWVLFFALRNEKDGSFHVKNLLRRRNLIALGIAMLALVVVTLTVPFVQRIVFRIFTTGQDSSTAIGGRVNKALELLEKMSMRQWINGVSDFTHGIKFNIPGVISVLYRHGLIGLVLAYEFYTKSLWKLKFPYALVAALVLVTSCFSAHTHSTIGMLYFMFILLAGYLEQRSVAQKSDRK